MTKILKGMLAALFVLLAVTPSPASPPPIAVSHTLSTDGDTVKTFIIHLSNRGDTALSGLTLSFPPAPPFAKAERSVNVPDLGPHQSVDVLLQLALHPGVGAAAFSPRAPLLFVVKGVDAKGAPVRFPAVSHPDLQNEPGEGGVK